MQGKAIAAGAVATLAVVVGVTPSPCTSIYTGSSPTTAPATSPRSGAGGRPQEIESDQEHHNEEYRSEPQEGQASTAWIFFHQLSQKECDLKGR